MSNYVPEIVYAGRTFRAPHAHLTPRASASELKSIRFSIAKVGVKEPVVVDANDNIIDGYRRLVSCLDLGMRLDQVPIDVRDVPQWEAATLAVELNAHRTHPRRGRGKPTPTRLTPEFLAEVGKYREMGLSCRSISMLTGVHPDRVYAAYRKLPPITNKLIRGQLGVPEVQAELLRSVGRPDLADVMAVGSLPPAASWQANRVRISFSVHKMEDIHDTVRRLATHPEHGKKLTPDVLRQLAKACCDVAAEVESSRRGT